MAPRRCGRLPPVSCDSQGGGGRACGEQKRSWSSCVGRSREAIGVCTAEGMLPTTLIPCHMLHARGLGREPALATERQEHHRFVVVPLQGEGGSRRLRCSSRWTSERDTWGRYGTASLSPCPRRSWWRPEQAGAWPARVLHR